MVDIYGRPFIRKVKQRTDVDLSTELKKYATKDEVDDLLNLAGVDPDEVASFQDKQGKVNMAGNFADLLTVAESRIQIYINQGHQR